MAASKATKSAWNAVIKKWCWTTSGFHKYGLKVHDILGEFGPEGRVVTEAVRRLPADVYDQRQFRISRALQLSLNKIKLPKDQWTKYEDEDYYLKPYLEELEREIKERKQWNKK